jgi:hypothetical protein
MAVLSLWGAGQIINHAWNELRTVRARCSRPSRRNRNADARPRPSRRRRRSMIALDRLALLVVSFGLRPILTPFALARSRPSPVRARINSRSNSATPLARSTSSARARSWCRPMYHDAVFDVGGSLRRLPVDVIEDRFKIGEHRKSIAKPQSPCLAKTARTWSSVAKLAAGGGGFREIERASPCRLRSRPPGIPRKATRVRADDLRA